MPKAIELFSGAGGLSLGLHLAGWSVDTAIESDAACVETYRLNFPDTSVVDGDVTHIDFRQFAGIDLVAGGPPCQPFSVAGKQLSKADPRDMVPEFVRAVREMRPRAFLMENVPGLLAPKMEGYIDRIVRALKKLGYSVHVKVLDAASFGVPQHRKRLFLVGVPPNTHFDFPSPSHGPGSEAPYVAARTVLSDAPPDEPNRAKVSYARKPVLRPSPWAGLLLNGKGRAINLNAPSLTIPASAGGNRTHIIDPGGILQRYHDHLMAGGRPRRGRVEQVRRLTVRESARLQSFPDTFVFAGKRSRQYSQVGNAVPPLLARAVSLALYEALYFSSDTSSANAPKRALLELAEMGS